MLAVGGCASGDQTWQSNWANVGSALGFTHTITCDSAALSGLADTGAGHRADPEMLRQARADVESGCTSAERG